MLKEAVNNKFEYEKLTPEEQKKRGILGRLVGVIADFKHPTRNGRLYSEELWDNVFKDPIMQEKIRTKTVLGELGHPESRTETDMEKVAICLAEVPTKFKDGTLRGVFDILDTPNGRILKALCEYGCDIGVSSRGEGDIIEGWDNDCQKVDPSTYSCETFDAVLLPAVAEARLKMVNESLDPKFSKLKKSLTESLNKASPEERKIMNETLKNLNINIDDNIAAEDIGADVIKQLQESIKQNKSLQDQVKTLQEKLSVCYAKEAGSVEKINNLEVKIADLTKINEAIKSSNGQLAESLSQAQEEAKRYEMRCKIASKQNNDNSVKSQSLNESIQSKNDKIRRLSESLRDAKEESQQLEEENSVLQESLEDIKQNSKMIKEDCERKVRKAKELVEHYKKIALTASNKYIEAKAKMIGVSTQTIKSKLHEGYSFNDIDNVCDSLQENQLRLGSLPFDVSSERPIKMKIKESTEPIKAKNRFDDDVDESLIKLANKIQK